MDYKKKSILFFLIALIISSCYDDKGNYEYHDLNKVEVVDSMSYYNTVSADDIFKVNPVLSYSIEENDNFKYEWFVEGELVFTGKNLVLKIADLPAAPRYNCKFIITDIANECKYIQPFKLTVMSKYYEGYILLTEKNGEYDLSYVNKKIEEADEDGEEDRITFNAYDDAYSAENGSKIKGICYYLKQHWPNYSDNDGILIVNSLGNIDLSGSTFVKTCCTNDYFLDGQTPANFSPIAENYLTDYSYIVDKEGNLYSRKHVDNKMLQSGRYVAEPVYIEKGLKITEVIDTPEGNSDFFMMYDAKNRRYVFASTDGELLVTDTEIENFSNLHDLKKDLVHCNFYEGDDWHRSKFYSILKDENNYYIQDFRFHLNSWSDPISADYSEEYVFNYSNIINEDSKFLKLRFLDYLFISIGCPIEASACLFSKTVLSSAKLV